VARHPSIFNFLPQWCCVEGIVIVVCLRQRIFAAASRSPCDHLFTEAFTETLCRSVTFHIEPGVGG
jgi:hypothetical protein